MPAPTEMVKGNTVLIILSCLINGPMHGYKIAREIERISEGYFALGEGTIYPHLHLLEQDGFIEGYWETVTGDRERKSYRITDKGKTELARRAEEWRKFQSKMKCIIDVAPQTS
jgi:PadR family transcriptional regulator, regulatory protein PadR